ncbi:MAG: TolC family protein [Hyphomonas sp.]|jgi:outer membrane protein TolC|uniref:Outer membrane protein n=1 Tax=Hyphomonas oceanitis SCH89 TaxID=1280953 RepID=A0A059G2I3_9PROT|nr:TolC family protein [Hyphomonas oceanitis]KDA00914.1 outer membrane protein [Hyphomonas oceanitis SCH89]|tara:strand:- start:4933 stop:6183 length:1251 start_codon:yes stop_codon:yes gene_type:complete
MSRLFLPAVAALSVSISVLLFGTDANAQTPLTLPETVSLALGANDPSVGAFEQKAQAFEDRAIADSQLPDPVLSAQVANFPLSSFDYNREPMTQLKFGLRQELPKGQTLSLTREKQSAQAKGIRFEKSLREQQIILEARQTWLELYYWRDARRLTLESQQKVAELGGVAEAVYSSGRSSLQDVLRVDLETVSLDAKLVDIDRNEDIARANFERLLGRLDGARDLSTAFPVLPMVQSEETIRDRLAMHPSMKALDARVDTKSREVDIAAEQFKPGLSFDAQYGLRDSRSDFGSIGVSVSLPLFSKKNKDYALSAAKRLRSSQKLERDTQALELERSLRRNWAQYTRLGERIDLYESDVLGRARETSEAAMTAYGNNLADFSELVRAELAVLDIELTLSRLRIDRLQAQASLLFLSGE